jgi:hypothetical protein
MLSVINPAGSQVSVAAGKVMNPPKKLPSFGRPRTGSRQLDDTVVRGGSWGEGAATGGVLVRGADALAAEVTVDARETGEQPVTKRTSAAATATLTKLRTARPGGWLRERYCRAGRGIGVEFDEREPATLASTGWFRPTADRAPKRIPVG